MAEFILIIMTALAAYWAGATRGEIETEKKINSACLIARQVQVDKTIIYCKPIAIMIDSRRQELKDGSVTTTDH